VAAIAVIQVISSVSAIAGWWASDPFDTGVDDPAVYLNSLSVIVAVIGLIVAVGLLLVVRWAWPLALFVLSVQLSVGLWAYYQDHPNFVTMALSVVAIFYLNSRDVRGSFGYIRPRESTPIE
jgi:hydrogenase/urease accessory protein HupE